MVLTARSGRVAGPVTFLTANDRKGTIPLGPCFVEEDDEGSVAVFWGESGEFSALLTSQEANDAANEGRLVLLD